MTLLTGVIDLPHHDGDMAADFAAAAGALDNVGGGRIRLGAGRYFYTTPPVFRTPVTISGAAMGSTALVTSADSPAVVWDVPSEQYGGGLRHLTVQSGNRTSGDGAVAMYRNLRNFECDHVRFFDGSTSLSTTRFALLAQDACYSGKITSSRFEYGAAASIGLHGKCNATTVEDVDFAPVRGGRSIWARGFSSLNVTRNHFEFAADDGGVHLDLEDCDRFRVTSNLFGNTGYGGAEVQLLARGASRLGTIVANTFNSALGKCVEFRNTSSYNSLVGNVYWLEGASHGVYWSGQSGISVVGEKFHVTRDAVACVKATGNADNGNISSNSIYGTWPSVAVTGFAVDAGCTYFNVVGNNANCISTGFDLQVNNGSPTTVFDANVAANCGVPLLLPHPQSVRCGANVGFPNL